MRTKWWVTTNFFNCKKLRSSRRERSEKNTAKSSIMILISIIDTHFNWFSTWYWNRDTRTSWRVLVLQKYRFRTDDKMCSQVASQSSWHDREHSLILWSMNNWCDWMISVNVWLSVSKQQKHIFLCVKYKDFSSIYFPLRLIVPSI